MCMFCAAIPVTVAVAAKFDTDQRAEIREAQESGGEVHPKPIKTIGAGLIVLLVVGSVVYHFSFS